MKINVCVNGTFRYPEYIRHYEQAGVLNRFHFAHARAATPASLGLAPAQAHNVWPKQYGMRAVFHWAPGRLAGPLSQVACDAWQRAVLRRWSACDSVEVVLGALADRIVAFARGHGVRVLGHPVTAHPETVGRLVGRAHESLGIDPRLARPADAERRHEEVVGCDGLIADSTHVARSYIAGGVPARRIAVIRPAVDLARFHMRSADDVDRDTFRVVCVGIVTPRKAQHVLIEAWRRLRLPRAELVLIGARGRHAGAVLRKAGAGIRHIAHVPHARLRGVLARASVFVLPSVEDGFGQAPLEAMACGVPTIVTDAVGMSDMIRSGHDGIVIPALNVDALAAAIDALHRDEERARAIGAAGSAKVHGSGDWARYAAAVIAQHRELLGSPQARVVGA